MSTFVAPPGARVHLHQAFRCCPYAGTISSQIHDYLEQNGYILEPDPRAADVHVINTCGSDARQAGLTWHVLDAIRAARPDSAVVVAGCLVSIEPRALGEALAPFARTARFDPRHLAGLDTVFSPMNVPFAEVPPAVRPGYTGNDFAEGWAHVLASTGCLGTCSFCAIRRATGRPKSRSITTILEEIARAEAAGVHDILLVSTDLSAWGTDRGETVVDLLRAVADAPGEFIVSGESFEPTLFLHHFEALLPILASGRFAFVGLPIQSGSARVLRRMERTYDPDAVIAAVERLHAAAPGLIVRTDLLYGFGDETEEEFDASIRASRAFDLPSFNAYQPRPGTAPMELPAEVVRGRTERALAELQARAQAGLPPLRRWGGEQERAKPKASAEPDTTEVRRAFAVEGGIAARDIEVLAATQAALHRFPAPSGTPRALLGEAELSAAGAPERLLEVWRRVDAAFRDTALPAGWCHGALHRDTVRVVGEHAGLLELDRLHIGRLVCDVAKTAVYVGYRGNDEKADPAKVIGYLRAYHRERPFTAEERAVLVPAILLALLEDVLTLAHTDRAEAHAAVVWEFARNEGNLQRAVEGAIVPS